MGMLSRMSTIVKSKMNRMLDNAEDPRETLDYSYEKQLEMLRNVKRGVVEMVAAKPNILHISGDQYLRDACSGCEVYGNHLAR